MYQDALGCRNNIAHASCVWWFCVDCVSRDSSGSRKNETETNAPQESRHRNRFGETACVRWPSAPPEIYGTRLENCGIINWDTQPRAAPAGDINAALSTHRLHSPSRRTGSNPPNILTSPANFLHHAFVMLEQTAFLRSIYIIYVWDFFSSKQSLFAFNETVGVVAVCAFQRWCPTSVLNLGFIYSFTYKALSVSLSLLGFNDVCCLNLFRAFGVGNRV